MEEDTIASSTTKKLKMNVVLCDSSSFKLRRHGSGLKKGNNQKVGVYLA